MGYGLSVLALCASLFTILLWVRSIPKPLKSGKDGVSRYGIALPAPKLGLPEHLQDHEKLLDWIRNLNYPNNHAWQIMPVRRALVDLCRHWRIERSRADHLEEIMETQEDEIRHLKAQLESLRGRKRTWGIFPRIHKKQLIYTRIMGKVDVRIRQLRGGYTLTTVRHIPERKPKVMTLEGWAAKHGHYIGGNDDSFAERHGFIKHGFVSRQPSRIEKPSVLALRIARDLKATELIYVTVPSCIWVWYKKSAESGETTQS